MLSGKKSQWQSAAFNLPPRRFPYGHSKHLAEQAVQEAIAQGLDAVIVNPTGVIGARDVHFIGGGLLREVQRGLSWFAPPAGSRPGSGTRAHQQAIYPGRRKRQPKAQQELELSCTPFRTAVERAYAWYLAHGYLQPGDSYPQCVSDTSA